MHKTLLVSTHSKGYKQFTPFYTLSNNKWEKNATNIGWEAASEITQFSPYGAEIENRDALMRYSSAQYGYLYKLPVAVASNTRYAELGFDNFEDYSILNGPKPHFSFVESVNNQNVIISNTASHTGTKSIMVKPNSAATLTRKIDPCNNEQTTSRKAKKINKK